ncbi:MAG: hypothetical protein FWF76_06685 [Oscillospiraceae bacterium]|nr:hypothetical protein [Oscillospiraceae bacterium]
MTKIKTKISTIAIVYIPMLLVFTVVRFLQYSRVIEPDSGFFAVDGGFMNSFYYIVIGISVILMLLFVLIDRRLQRGILSKAVKSKKGIVQDVVAELDPAIAELLPNNADSTHLEEKSLTTVLPKPRTELPIAFVVVGTVLAGVCGIGIALQFVTLLSEGNAGLLRLALLGLSSVGMTFVGFSLVTKRKIVPAVALALLFLAGFSVSTAAIEFMARTYTANISSRLIILSANLLFAVFFLSVGRIIVKSETRFTAIVATLSGYLVTLIALSDFIARAAYYLTTNEETRLILSNGLNENGFELQSPVFIAQAFLVLWFLHSLSVSVKKNV